VQLGNEEKMPGAVCFVLFCRVFALYKSGDFMQIYIHREGQQFGPYSVEQARDYVGTGNLLAEDLAWHEGAANWAPLAGVLAAAQAEGARAVVEPARTEARAWIPARRADIPPKRTFGLARTPGNLPVEKSPVEPAETGSGTAPEKVRRRPRRRSPNASSQFQRSIAARNMGIGAISFLGGVGITFFSFEMASASATGGVFVLAWGAILFGGVRFVTALIQFCKG
jgi:hypothetical protein